MPNSSFSPQYNQNLLPAEDVKKLLYHALTSHDVNDLEHPGRCVLSTLLASPGFDPNTLIDVGADQFPVLHLALRSLAGRNFHTSAYDDKYVRVSVDPSSPLPAGLYGLPALERAAIHLLRQGADPWAKDHTGRDAFDLAVAARSRTLVDMLMSHPERPDLDQLTSRTHNAVGREVPLTHVAAYLSSPELFADLINFGWDYAAKDRNGWPALAWVNNPETLKVVAKFFTSDQLSDMSMDVSNAFSQRHSKKLTENSFNLNILKAQLDSLVVPSQEQQLEQELFNLSEMMLSNKPNKPSYHYTGPDFRSEQSRKEFFDKCLAHFDWRREVKSGAAKGTWSLPSMLLWGSSRTQNHSDAYTNISLFIQQLLAEKTPQQRQAWLDEEIRPGVSNRGFFAWGLGTVMSSSLADTLSEGLSAPAKQLLEQATAVVENFSAKNMAYQWSDRLGNNWKGLAFQFVLPQAVDQTRNACQGWFYESFSRVSAIAQLSIPAPICISLSYKIMPMMSSDSLTSSEMSWACSLLSYGYSSLTGARGGGIYRDNEAPREYYDTRSDLFSAFSRALENNPSLASEQKFPYPFKVRSKTLEESLPSEDEWNSMIKRAVLANIAATTQSAKPSSVKRPSM